MTDELDDYEEDVEDGEGVVDELADEQQLSDADQLLDITAELDETPFDETRLQYSGVEADDSDVDLEEYEEAGALFDDPDAS